jgi:hypothetical protein
MKKSKIYIVLIVLLCIAVVICIAKFAASATDEIPTSEVTEAVEVENTPTEEEVAKTPIITTEEIVKWIQSHLEEILVMIVSTVLAIYQRRSNSSTKKSIATCNNNALAIAENSNNTVATALTELAAMTALVAKCKDEINELLAEIRLNDEEKKQLQAALAKVETHLETAKLANIEFANELAELLVLANIPNSKKEELYARHRASVAAIDAVDHTNTEVKEDVGEEA